MILRETVAISSISNLLQCMAWRIENLYDEGEEEEDQDYGGEEQEE